MMCLVLCGRRNTCAIVQLFQKIICRFRGKRYTLETSDVILRGRRSTLDVSCSLLFCESHCQRAKWWPRAHSVARMVLLWHMMILAWWKPCTKPRFWARSIRKLVGRRRVWSYGVWNFEEVSHEMLVLMLQHVSSRGSGFPVGSPCLWGELQNPSFLKVSRQVVMSFCVAGTALPDISTCLQKTCRKSACVAGAMLLCRFQKIICSFVANATLCRLPSSFCMASAEL